MRTKVAAWTFIVCAVGLLVVLGVMLAAGVDWWGLVMWLLAWPALIVLGAAMAAQPKCRAKNLTGHPPTTTVISITQDGATLTQSPQYGAMKEDEDNE